MKRTWITKEGKKIKIKDLTESHLINIYNMIVRHRLRCLNSAYNLSTILTGEIACFYIEQDIDNLEEMDDYDYVESLCPEIIREMCRRNLYDIFKKGGQNDRRNC